MSVDQLDALLERMPEIAKAVNEFSSEAVQQTALNALVAAFTNQASNPPVQSEGLIEADNLLDGQKLKKARRPSRKSRNAEKEISNGFDEVALVNQIKQDSRFPMFRTKIVVGSASREQQVKFVSWCAGETPLTSGNMMRCLNLLGVKMSAPQASKAVSAAMSDYMETPGSSPKTFRLSAPALVAFESWLLNEERAG